MTSKQTKEMPFPKYVANHEAEIAVLVTNQKQVVALGPDFKDLEPVDAALLSNAEWPRKGRMRRSGEIISVLNAEMYDQLRAEVDLQERLPAPPKWKNFRLTELRVERERLIAQGIRANQKYPGPLPGAAIITHRSGCEAAILPEQAKYFSDEWDGLPVEPLPEGHFTLNWAAEQAAEQERKESQAHAEQLAKAEREEVERQQMATALAVTGE